MEDVQGDRWTAPAGPDDRWSAPLAFANAHWVVQCLSSGTRSQAQADDELLAAIARVLVPVALGPDQVICRPDGRPEGVWILRNGIVELATREGNAGVVTQVLYRGDVVGTEQLVSNQSMPWLARTASHTSALFLPRADVIALLAASGHLRSNILVGFAHRLVTSSARLAAVLERDAERRAARMILVEERGGVVPIPQATLAAITGTSRPGLNKALNELSKRRLIELGYRRITVVDRARLASFARLGQDDEPAPPTRSRAEHGP